MLLCLRMQEFPVDVNVGRICSRLGWIPLDSDLGIEVWCAMHGLCVTTAQFDTLSGLDYSGI